MCKESISYHKSDMASFLIMILAILIIIIKNVSSSTSHKKLIPSFQDFSFFLTVTHSFKNRFDKNLYE